MDIDALTLQSIGVTDPEQFNAVRNGRSSGRWRPHSGYKGGAKYTGSFESLASDPNAPREIGPTLGSLRRCGSLRDSGTITSSDSRLDSTLDRQISTSESDSVYRTSSSGGRQMSSAPVARSRSSYSFDSMSSLLTIPNLTRRKSPTELVPKKKSDSVRKKGGKDGGGGAEDANEGFLSEVETQDFSGVWNHPITRSYFLMYLLWRGFANLYYFRMDAQQFRLDYPMLYTSARKSHAYRLYNLYLVEDGPLSIFRHIPVHFQNVNRQLTTIGANLEHHCHPAMFDDLAYMVLNWLRDIYNGTFDGYREGQQQTGIPPFKQSAFYQAMKNDLRGTRNLTTVQYHRAAERIVDMPPVVYDGKEVWEKLLLSLEAMGIDCEPYRARGPGAELMRKPSIERKSGTMDRERDGTLPKKSKVNRTRSMTSLTDSKAASPESPSTGAPPTLKEWKRAASNNALNSYMDTGELLHTFVQYTGGDQEFCEYCHRRVNYDKGSEDSHSAYRCETCHYVCHKNCRNSVRISCVMPSTAAAEIEDQCEVFSEKQRRVTERIQALQREIDIEMKIRDGLDNLVRAKQESSSKSSKKQQIPPDMDSQIERVTKKLERLKHEMQKCRLQSAALAAAAHATEVRREAESKHQRGPSTSNKYADETNEGEVIKVVTMDSAMKAESTKLVFITPHTTVKDVITLSLQKFNLPGNADDYLMSYTTPEGEDVPLRHEDHPSKLGLNLMETPFRLRVNFDTGTSSGAASGLVAKLSKEDEQRARKQRDVLMEIVETEISYSEDLKNIVNIFYKPLALADVLDAEAQNDIFANIKEIADFHDMLSKQLAERREDILRGNNLVIPVMQLYEQHMDQFRLYEVYCGNQQNAGRRLEKVKSDPAFTKLLAQCECNPKLNKLKLADLLVKPMHRITRYPMFLKRLLASILKDTPEYELVNSVINNIEQRINDVNESARRHESAYRINMIDENLDFNNVYSRFKLANKRRELISEKPMTYIKKNTSSTVQVIVLFFTDMVMIVRQKKPDTFILFKPPIPLEAAVFLDKPDAHGKFSTFGIQCGKNRLVFSTSFLIIYGDTRDGKPISNYPPPTRNPHITIRDRI
ncbi:hypothetical protein BC832DRAFT_69814 [Gaertneriomyces semiglobifer]|nr:hypothetical protein BC832DRAFT_69814 [Gaertneriomyces semiglobifer]